MQLKFHTMWGLSEVTGVSPRPGLHTFDAAPLRTLAVPAPTPKPPGHLPEQPSPPPRPARHLLFAAIQGLWLLWVQEPQEHNRTQGGHLQPWRRWPPLSGFPAGCEVGKPWHLALGWIRNHQGWGGLYLPEADGRTKGMAGCSLAWQVEIGICQPYGACWPRGACAC